MQAPSPASSHILSLALYAPTAASSREHYYAQYASSRSGDAGSHPRLVLRLQTPTNTSLSHADGKGLHCAVARLTRHLHCSSRQVVHANVTDTEDGSYTVRYALTVTYSMSE